MGWEWGQCSWGDSHFSQPVCSSVMSHGARVKWCSCEMPPVRDEKWESLPLKNKSCQHMPRAVVSCRLLSNGVPDRAGLVLERWREVQGGYPTPEQQVLCVSSSSHANARQEALPSSVYIFCLAICCPHFTDGKTEAQFYNS